MITDLETLLQKRMQEEWYLIFPFILLGVNRDYSVHTSIQSGSIVNFNGSMRLCDVVFV